MKSRFVPSRFMKSTMCLALASSFLMLVGISFAQSPEQPAPERDDTVGRQLIAWSQLQKPQPIPQRPDPIPPPDTQSGQQPSSPAQTQPQPDPKPERNAQSQNQNEPEATTITGMIAKSGDKFVLQTKDKAVYELDNQDQVGKYEGKQVKIIGTLDRVSNMIHVRNIELLS